MEYSKSVDDYISRYKGDIPPSAIENAKRVGTIAWDIETTGLDWKKDLIGTCQVYIPEDKIYIINIDDESPVFLQLLLQDDKICKIFHYAPFDLRFMSYCWSVEPRNVACTKIASKILNPFRMDHSLKTILQDYLGVMITKDMRLSNWLITELTHNQLAYAAADVFYLPRLFNELKYQLVNCNRWNLAEASFKYMPTRIKLDILGSNDVFDY